MSWLRRLSRSTRLVLCLVLVTGLLGGPFLPSVMAQGTDSVVESTSLDTGGHDDSDSEYSKGEALALAGTAGLGVALSGVALSYLLPMALGPVSFLPTALIWGSAAIAAPVAVYLYNHLLERNFQDHMPLALLTVGAVGLLGAAGAAALLPAAGVVAGLIGAAAGTAVGLPLFKAMAVEDEDDPDLDGDETPLASVDNEDDEEDQEEYSDEEFDDYEDLWDQYNSVDELYERVAEAYRRFLKHSRCGNHRRGELWLRRYRRLEDLYREERDRYEENREELGY